MKRYVISLLLAFTSSLAVASPGYDDGYDAWRSGNYAKALLIFQDLAEKGYDRAEFMLSRMYTNGQGVPVDHEKATTYAQLAADHGNPQAMVFVSSRYFDENSKDRDPVKGFEWLEKGVKLHDSNSMRILALRLALGRETDPDPARAFSLMRECGNDSKNPYCTIDLGKMYEYGIGTAINYSQARRQFEKMKDGDGTVEWHLGRMFEVGLGMNPNPTRAMEYYMAAVTNAQNSAAMNRIGMLFEKGIGTPVDLAKAAIWYEKAANARDLDGLVNYGRLLLEGKGIKQSETEAVRYFKLAASKDNPEGMRALARLYDSSDSPLLDHAKARKIYCQAAIAEQRRSEVSLDWSDKALPPGSAVKRLAFLQACNANAMVLRLTSRLSPEEVSQAEALKLRLLKAASSSEILADTNGTTPAATPVPSPQPGSTSAP